MKDCTSKRAGSEIKVGLDPLSELIRTGSRDLIAQAIGIELEVVLSEYKDLRLPDGRSAVVRNGYLPPRELQTGVGNVEVSVPKIRDRSEQGIDVATVNRTQKY